MATHDQKAPTTTDLMMMVLYVQIFKAGGVLSITQAEYEEAFREPQELTVNVLPGGGTITVEFHRAPLGGVTCFDPGDGLPLCGESGARVVAIDPALVTCVVCITILREARQADAGLRHINQG